MNSIIQKINDLITQINVLPSISDESKRQLDKKFRLEFNFNSNHIEGNTLTYGETQLLLYFDKTDGTHEMREYEEMKAHDLAYKLIQEWAQETERPILEIDIKELNKIILVRDFYKDAITPDGQPTKRKLKVGQYKEFPNSVRLQNGEMFDYATPQDTPIEMATLMQFYHAETEKNELYAVELAAFIHYKFVCIHPFDDGNGRISRLLMNYILLKNGLPPVVIKSADKKNYLNALNQADTGNLQAFVDYIAKQLVWSLELVLKATKGENIEETNDIYKEIELFKKEQLATIEKKDVKTNELVQKCWRINIERFLIVLDNEIIVFNDMFLANTNKIYLEFLQIKKEELNFGPIKHILDRIENAVDIMCDLTLIKWERQLLKSINDKTKDTLLTLNINFEASFFSITLNQTLILSKKYNTKLEDFEIKDAVNKCMKLAFEEIKKNTIK